jgi:hypothetical protein
MPGTKPMATLQPPAFYQPEFIDDYSVSSALVQAVTKWAHGKGMKQLIGSFGLSDKDPQGIQIERVSSGTGHRFG